MVPRSPRSAQARTRGSAQRRAWETDQASFVPVVPVKHVRSGGEVPVTSSAAATASEVRQDTATATAAGLPAETQVREDSDLLLGRVGARMDCPPAHTHTQKHHLTSHCPLCPCQPAEDQQASPMARGQAQPHQDELPARALPPSLPPPAGQRTATNEDEPAVQRHAPAGAPDSHPAHPATGSGGSRSTLR